MINYNAKFCDINKDTHITGQVSKQTQTNSMLVKNKLLIRKYQETHVVTNRINLVKKTETCDKMKFNWKLHYFFNQIAKCMAEPLQKTAAISHMSY